MTGMPNRWMEGLDFYKAGGVGRVPDDDDPGLIDWMKGFCTEMADYDLDGGYPSIQAALLDHGIDADLLEACLGTAERITKEPEFNRWPSAPLRGFGDGNLSAGPFVIVLPDAANDEKLSD
jgi:hypothetical protein